MSTAPKTSPTTTPAPAHDVDIVPVRGGLFALRVDGHVGHRHYFTLGAALTAAASWRSAP